MNIKRKTFTYTAGQEEAWTATKPEDDQEVVPAELEVEVGLLGSKKEIKKGWRPLNKAEVLERVYEFVNALGKPRLVNLCEYTRCDGRIGDDRMLVWVVWYWEGN